LQLSKKMKMLHFVVQPLRCVEQVGIASAERCPEVRTPSVAGREAESNGTPKAAFGGKAAYS
jgi:hypothetical protein